MAALYWKTLFLRKKQLQNSFSFKERKTRKGFTLIEVLIVVTIISLLILIALWAWQSQLAKGKDARRKADLNRLEKVFEDFYNDNNCYPNDLNDLVPDYLSEVLVDPVTRQAYELSNDGCHTYRIYVNLDNEDDLAIAEAGCTSGCGPGGGTLGGDCSFNYGVCNSGDELESCESCSLSCQTLGNCDDLLQDNWNCPRWFCDLDQCMEACANPANLCTEI